MRVNTRYKDVPLVEFLYLVLIRIPGESYRSRLTGQVFVVVFVWRLSNATDLNMTPTVLVLILHRGFGPRSFSDYAFMIVPDKIMY